MLFVGTIEPRKNIDTLLDAWGALPADLRDAHDLVIAGPIGWASGSTVARLQSGMSGVRVIGYVPEQRAHPQERRRSFIHRCMRDSGFRSYKRWPRAFPLSRRIYRHYRKWWQTAACSWTRRAHLSFRAPSRDYLRHLLCVKI